MVNFSQSGCSKKIILYSTKFDKVGGFANASSGSAFSWTADAEHTEKWCVWIMASENDAWASYGSNALEQNKKVDYDYTYTIPDGQNQSVFALWPTTRPTGAIRPATSSTISRLGSSIASRRTRRPTEAERIFITPIPRRRTLPMPKLRR